MEQINIAKQEIVQTIKNWFGISPEQSCFYIDGWLAIEDEALIHELGGMDINHSDNADVALNLLIKTINQCGYGAGCHYELYEERRQMVIQTVMHYLSYKLSKEKKEYFKKSVDYIEDFQPYVEQCEECGADVNALTGATSSQETGEILCRRCC